jgi:ATP-dependent DNA ligase
MEEKILEIKTFEPLFGKSKDGKTKNWEIKVERYQDYSEIVTLHGYINKIESRIRVNKGKNIGKANETNHFQQAISEALSKWTKKKDIEKYNTSTIEEISPVKKQTETKVLEPKLPMLAQDFSKHKKKLSYPCFIQPKLDGYRMIYDSKQKTITTRQGKEFTIVKQSGKLFEELSSISSVIILDGELYVKDLSFESLGVLRKTKGLTDSDKQNLKKIEYHIYDCIDANLDFETRFLKIKHLTEQSKFEMIKLVDTFEVKSENEIQEKHQVFVQNNFEGSILRNKKAKYLEKNRSYDLLKYKDFMDAEFEIINFTFEKDTSGDDKNLVVWIIKIKEDLECKVRPKGTKEQRQSLYEQCESDFSKFKGRKLWTKFFDYTTDGSLRFPTTKTNDVESYIRNDIV